MARDTEPDLDTPVPAPRANPDLVGHEAAERELERLYRTGRLPHAILLAGPRGIGKATLAFRFARFLLAQGEAGRGDKPCRRHPDRTRACGRPARAVSSAASRRAAMPTC